MVDICLWLKTNVNPSETLWIFALYKNKKKRKMSARPHLYAPAATRSFSTAYFFHLVSTELLKWTNAAVKPLLTFRCKMQLCDAQGQMLWYLVISGPHRLLRHAYWALNYKHTINDMMSRCGSGREDHIKTSIWAKKTGQSPHWQSKSTADK